ASGNGIETANDELDDEMELQPNERVKNNTWKYTLASTLNHKFGSAHANRSGFIFNSHHYDVLNREAEHPGDPLAAFADGNGSAVSVQAFSQSALKLTNKLDLNLGFHLHYFGLNDE